MFGIDAIATLADSVVKRVWPDATEIEKAKLEKLTAELQAELSLQLGQLEINKAEAASSNWFASSWRPFVGWVCGMSLAYAAVIEPIARFIAQVCFGYVGYFPALDTTITLQVLLGMLGFGATRSLDKYLGTVKK